MLLERPLANSQTQAIASIACMVLYNKTVNENAPPPNALIVMFHCGNPLRVNAGIYMPLVAFQNQNMNT